MSLKTLIHEEIDRLRGQRTVVLAAITTKTAELNALRFERDNLNADIDEAQAWLDAHPS